MRPMARWRHRADDPFDLAHRLGPVRPTRSTADAEHFGQVDPLGRERRSARGGSSRSPAQLGFLLGAAGNQTVQAEQQLRALNLPVDFIGTSAVWGVEKPSAGFFVRIVGECGCPPEEIAYVGETD
jgi:hypothetical protein